MSTDANNSSSALKDQIKDMLNNAKTELQGLEVQLSLGKAEAVEAFEAQKASLNTRLEEAKQFLQELSEKGKVQAGAMQQELEKLQVQLSLGKAETLEGFKAQEQQIATAVGAFKEKAQGFLADANVQGEEKVKLFMEEMDKRSTEFKTKMDVFRVQLALGEQEAQEGFEKYRKEVLDAARTLSQQIDEKIDAIEDKAEEIGEEIAEKLNDFKKSFTGMFGA
jgi:hypothetical protein